MYKLLFAVLISILMQVSCGGGTRYTCDEGTTTIDGCEYVIVNTPTQKEAHEQ